MSNNNAIRRRRWFLRLTSLSIVLAILVGTVLMHTVQLSSIDTVQGQVNNFGSWLSIMRCAFIGCVAVLWTPIVRHLHASNRIPDIHTHELLALRWRVIAWLLILELLIGQHLIPRLIAALTGTP